MDRVARLFAIVVLMVFAVSTATHLAGTTRMALAMSPIAMGDGHMGDCDGCPPADDGKTQVCEQVCLVPFAAIPAAAGFELPFVTVDSAISLMDEIVGRTGPPDPYPPRTSHLS